MTTKFQLRRADPMTGIGLTGRGIGNTNTFSSHHLVRKAIRLGSLAALVAYIGLGDQLIAAPKRTNHLVPVVRSDISSEYRKLWESKLLITPGDVAGFVLLSGGTGTEGAASIYQQAHREGALQGDYWLTITEPSAYLGQFLAPSDATRSLALEKVKVKRWDAPLPVSTAQVIHRLWLTILSQTTPDPNADVISVDTSTAIFSAKDSIGKGLEAQTPKLPGKDMTALIKIAFSLHDYAAVASKSERPKLAAEIEKDAHALLGRVEKR